MKTAGWICVLLLGAASTAMADVADLSFTVLAYSPTAGTSDGTMAFTDEGGFTYDSSVDGEQTGFYLEGEDAQAVPVVYGMYFNDQDELRFVYAQTTSVDLIIVPLTLIYGVGFGENEFYVFGGYAVSFDLSNLPF